jgi:hypothetical protein
MVIFNSYVKLPEGNLWEMAGEFGTAQALNHEF